MDIVWLNAEANRQTAERLMLAAERSDIYVLPEMWNTGTTTEPQGVAESQEGDTVRWMQRMADRLDAAVVGSIAIACPRSNPTSGECSYSNRLYFVKPGEIVNCKSSNCKWYDKHHLFSYGGETKSYVPGNERVTVEWRGLRFRLSICYDLRFPIWLRNTDDYDVLVCVASWPSARIHAWNVLLQARAIENQCYVLGVNRIGSDPACQYIGGTAVVDPFGTAATLPEGEAGVLTRTLDLKRLRAFREKFPVLRERDTL